jgi:hypothetical protein
MLWRSLQCGINNKLYLPESSVNGDDLSSFLGLNKAYK